MELRQLAYLVAVVEEGTFTAAAERVHVAQPGVSAQVRQLEHELGQILLERTPHGVRLTEAGAAVLPYARAALHAVADMRHAVAELTGLLRGRLRVGAVGSISSPAVDLPGVLAGFSHRHPAVEIALKEDTSDRLLSALADGELDLVLVGETGQAPAGVEAQIVAEEPLTAAVSADHPLAKRATVTLDALRDQPLISMPHGSGLRLVLDNACAAAGFRPHVAFEAGDPSLLAELAARGLGVAVITRAAVEARAGGLRPVEITSPRLQARLALAWRAHGATSPAAKALIEHARAQLPNRAVIGRSS